MSFDDAMHEVLQTSRYDLLMGRRVDAGTWFSDLFARIIINLLERINISALSINATGGANINTIATIFAVVGLIIVVVTGVVLYRTLMRAKQNMDYDLSDIFEELAHRHYTVEELLHLSHTASDRRISVRYSYIAALIALDEKEIIRISPSATNRIILQDIQRAAPDLVSPFSRLVDVFHWSWFGHKAVGDEDFLNFSGAVDTLVSKVGDAG